MRFLIFLVLNFGALALGALLMGGSPVTNEWYNGLNKAPWTPPGWMFGFAWTTIMIFFSFYMSRLVKNTDSIHLLKVYGLFAIQWILNVSWNLVFFNWHFPILGAVVILLLMLTLVVFQVFYNRKNNVQLFLILPYLLWLGIALSLNIYVI